MSSPDNADAARPPHATPATAAPQALPVATLAGAIDTVDACVAILAGPALRFTFANRACQELRPGSPMLGRPLREVFPATTQGGLETQLLRVLHTGEPLKLNRFESVSQAGDLRFWEGEVVPAAANGDAEPAIVVFARNVTATVRVERALAASEEALRRSNRKLRDTIDSITDGLLVIDRDWRYTVVSDRAATILGMRQEDLIGGRVWDLFPYTAGTKFYDCYHQAMTSGQPVQFEEYYPAPLDLWLECNCYPTPEGLTVYFRDVSERYHAEQALRESTTLLSAISDSSPDVIYAKDAQGRLRFANPATVALIGKPIEQILGRTDAELLADPEVARQVMENDRRIMESGAGEELEELVPMPDGEHRIWLSMKIALCDKGGQVVGLLGISRDITDRKRAEQRAARGRPAQGRVPGDAGARAAQPAGADPHRARAAAARAHDRRPVRSAPATSSRARCAHDEPGRRPAGRLARHARPDRAARARRSTCAASSTTRSSRPRPLIEAARPRGSRDRAAEHRCSVDGDRTRLVAGGRQPAEQRRQVHAAAGGQIGLPARARRRAHVVISVARQRHRHRARPAAARVRPVHARPSARRTARRAAWASAWRW